METTRLSTKGQVILPKSVRDARALKPGTEFTVEDRPDGILLRPMKRFPPSRLEDVVGCLPYKGKPITDEEMKAGIRKMILERHARGRY